MAALSETETRTVSALYREEAAAERAVAGLREIGIPDRQINERRGREGALAPAGHGLMAALGEFFMPENDRWHYQQGLDRGAILVVATDLAPKLADEALDILDREGIDLEEEWTGTDPIDKGAIGTDGGAGTATGEFDRLTGERIGAPGTGRRVSGPGHRRARAYTRDGSGS